MNCARRTEVTGHRAKGDNGSVAISIDLVDHGQQARPRCPGFWPRERMTVPSSLVVMVPSPSLSKREKASLNSVWKKELWDWVSWWSFGGYVFSSSHIAASFMARFPAFSQPLAARAAHHSRPGSFSIIARITTIRHPPVFRCQSASSWYVPQICSSVKLSAISYNIFCGYCVWMRRGVASNEIERREGSRNESRIPHIICKIG